MDPRRLFRDQTFLCMGLQQQVSDYLGDITGDTNRYTNYGDVYFEYLEVKVTKGLMYIGATFDQMYLGRPQNWPQF